MTRKQRKRQQRKQQRNKERKRSQKGTQHMSQEPLKPLSDEELEELIAQHNVGGAFKQAAVVGQSCWDAGIVIKGGCNHMEMPKYHISFEPLAH